MKKLEIFGNKIGLKGYKWSGLNAPSTKSQSGCANSLFPFQIFFFWGNNNWPPQDVGEKVGNFWEQNELNRLQMVWFEYPRVNK